MEQAMKDKEGWSGWSAWCVERKYKSSRYDFVSQDQGTSKHQALLNKGVHLKTSCDTTYNIIRLLQE